MDGIDPLWRYLPAEFAARLPRKDGFWRGRVALLLWALGYPFEMAWSVAMDRDRATSRRFKASIGRLDDRRLVALLDATEQTRSDAARLRVWRILKDD